jgi:hypothetical protein
MSQANPIRFIVFAPSYDPNKGGFILLHYLCHLLNDCGFEAFLIPAFRGAAISPLDDNSKIVEAINFRVDFLKQTFEVRSDWKTPLYRQSWKSIRHDDRVVSIYPETVFGNPLRGKNVARWILNTPGTFDKRVFFTPGEVHFKYLDMHKPLSMPWIEIAEHKLSVVHVPWQYYAPPTDDSSRQGTAYLVYKGKGKPLVHDVASSVKIDGMSHAQIGEIFRKVKTFISYDAKTLYSPLAAIAGADSVVIPDDGVSEDEWLPEKDLRVGIAYGFERLEWARSTRHLTADRFRRMETESRRSVFEFARFWEERLLGSTQTNGGT